MTGIKKEIWDMRNINGTIIELQHNKITITKEYKGKRQPELRKITQQLNTPLRKNIKKAIIFIEVEYNEM